MKLKIDYSLNDLYEAHKLHYFSGKLKYYFYFLATICFLSGLLIFFDGYIPLVQILIIVFLLTYQYWFLRLYTSYQFKRTPYLQGEVTFDFNDEGIVTTASNMNGHIEWSAYTKAVHNNKVLLIYPGYGIYTVIPKRVLQEEEWNKLLELVKQKVTHR